MLIMLMSCGHPCFWNFNCIISVVVVVMVKSFLENFLDSGSMSESQMISNPYFLPKWMMVGLTGMFSNDRNCFVDNSNTPCHASWFFPMLNFLFPHSILKLTQRKSLNHAIFFGVLVSDFCVRLCKHGCPITVCLYCLSDLILLLFFGIVFVLPVWSRY